jgi:hypothetical protein
VFGSATVCLKPKAMLTCEHAYHLFGNGEYNSPIGMPCDVSTTYHKQIGALCPPMLAHVVWKALLQSTRAVIWLDNAIGNGGQCGIHCQVRRVPRVLEGCWGPPRHLSARGKSLLQPQCRAKFCTVMQAQLFLRCLLSPAPLYRSAC